MSPATPPLLAKVRPMTWVKPQLEKVPPTSPRQANCGAGVGGGGALVAVGWGAGGRRVLVGLGRGVLVGGAGVAVGGWVLVGGGVDVAVMITGVLVGVTGVAVAVGGWVFVGTGVSVGNRVAVKVGLGVLVGVAVGPDWRESKLPVEQAIMATSMVIAMTRITTRFLIVFFPPVPFTHRAGIGLRAWV
jgi:hypothetical protein